MKQKLLSKKASVAVSKAIAVITSIVLGSAMMAGLCVTVKRTVLPTTTTKIESMFGMTGDITEDLGGGVFPTTDRFDDGPCDSYYYDTLQNAVADASAHTTANANATESTGKAFIEVRQSDDMYIVKPTTDQTITSAVPMSNKMIFDTNGKQIQLAAGAEFKPQAGSEITFRDSGTGKIYKDVDSSGTEMIINAQTVTNCTINVLNGTYNLKNKTGNAFVFRNGGTTYIKKGSFSSESESSNSMAIATGGQSDISNIMVASRTVSGLARAVQLSGNTNLKDCDIKTTGQGAVKNCGILVAVAPAAQGGSTSDKNLVFSNINIVSENGFTSKTDENRGVGISIDTADCVFNVSINNCNIKATREALSLNSGNIAINGGTYEGIQHGGAYFSCDKAVVKNATFRKWDYDGQFNKDNFYSNNAAFYTGSAKHDVKVYMDNCKVENASNATLSSSYNHKSTYLYASNTAFNNIRIDGSNSVEGKGHMFIGKGSTYKSTSGSGDLDTTTYANVEFTPEYVKNNFN